MNITNKEELQKAQNELDGLNAMLNRYADHRNFIRDIQRKHPGIPESAIWQRFDVLQKAIEDYYSTLHRVKAGS
jgi:hypothetical protein